MLFRLPYGGVYSDTRKDAEDLMQFLESFAYFMSLARSRIASITAVESMGLGHYQVRLSSGEVVQHKRSLLGEPKFGLLIGDL